MSTARATVPIAFALLMIVGQSAPSRGAAPDPVQAGRRALSRVCEALERGDDRSIQRHVRLPLRVRLITSENAGNPITKTVTLTTPGAVREARLCRGLWVRTARVTATKRGGWAIAEIGQFDARLEWVDARQGPRLVSYRQPAR